LPLFFKTGQKEGYSNLQYSGLSFAPVFQMHRSRGPGQKRALLRKSPGKKIGISPFFLADPGPDGKIYVAKRSSISGPLVAIL
jgi:hypothetical protein